MKAVCGTGKQEFGPKNIIFYAFINVEELYKNIPRIEIYMTGNGRIVTGRNIPASLVVKVRRNDAMGTEMKDAMKVPDPPAPAGAPRVKSRDSQGSSLAPMGSNYTDLPLPGRTTVTTDGKELKSGHMNMLPHLVQGSPWEQHRELQMAKGVFRSVQCHHELSRGGCQKGDWCVFRHHDDNPKAIIANEAGLVRFRIYTKLFNNGYTLPPQILLEIGKITEEQLKAALGARARHQERLDEQAMHEQAARAQRPKMHDNSRSPRSSPRERDSITPDPQRRGPENYDDLLRLSKGKGRGGGSTVMEVDAEAVVHSRGHTSGRADEEASDREEEAVAPIEDDNMNFNPPEDEEPRSLSPGDQEVVTEPVQQLADKSGDVVMEDDAPTVDA